MSASASLAVRVGRRRESVRTDSRLLGHGEIFWEEALRARGMVRHAHDNRIESFDAVIERRERGQFPLTLKLISHQHVITQALRGACANDKRTELHLE